MKSCRRHVVSNTKPHGKRDRGRWEGESDNFEVKFSIFSSYLIGIVPNYKIFKIISHDTDIPLSIFLFYFWSESRYKCKTSSSYWCKFKKHQRNFKNLYFSEIMLLLGKCPFEILAPINTISHWKALPDEASYSHIFPIKIPLLMLLSFLYN